MYNNYNADRMIKRRCCSSLLKMIYNAFTVSMFISIYINIYLYVSTYKINDNESPDTLNNQIIWL